MRPRVVGAMAVALASLTGACTSEGSVDDADVVEIFGPWRGTDADRFAAVLVPFEAATGIDVRYVGSIDFVADLLARTGDRNDPPDVAVIPQPALVRELAADDQILPLDPVTLDAVLADFGEEAAELGRIDGLYFTVPFRVSVKSLVWFRPDVFADRGWVPPSTLDELDQLVASIQADGTIAPWCLGINAGSATGWVATDWVEDLVLRSIGADRYQRWVEGGIRFEETVIENAFEQFRSLALESGRVRGGRAAILSTRTSEAIAPLVADPPECAMHRQADFAANWLPDGTSIGADGDVDVFVLPGTTERPPPLLIGGDQVVRFRRTSSIDALMGYLASPEAAAIWAKQGGFLSLNQSVPDSAYPDDHLRGLTAAIGDAPSIVFDGSDQMPTEIGSDLLWERITAWVAGVDDYDTFAAAIDAAFDELAANDGVGP